MTSGSSRALPVYTFVHLPWEMKGEVSLFEITFKDLEVNSISVMEVYYLRTNSNSMCRIWARKGKVKKAMRRAEHRMFRNNSPKKKINCAPYSEERRGGAKRNRKQRAKDLFFYQIFFHFHSIFLSIPHCCSHGNKVLLLELFWGAAGFVYRRVCVFVRVGACVCVYVHACV